VMSLSPMIHRQAGLCYPYIPDGSKEPWGGSGSTTGRQPNMYSTRDPTRRLCDLRYTARSHLGRFCRLSAVGCRLSVVCAPAEWAVVSSWTLQQGPHCRRAHFDKSRSSNHGATWWPCRYHSAKSSNETVSLNSSLPSVIDALNQAAISEA